METQRSRIGGTPPRALLLGLAMALTLAACRVGGSSSVGGASVTVSPGSEPTASAASPTPSPAPPQVLLDQSGTGVPNPGRLVTPDFAVDGTWDLKWTKECPASASGMGVWYSVDVERGGGTAQPGTLTRAGSLAVTDQGTVHEPGGGILHLVLETPCKWHLTVTGSPLLVPTPSPAEHALLDQSGTGPATVKPFTAVKGWDLHWRFDCSQHPTNSTAYQSISGPFQIQSTGVEEGGIEHSDRTGVISFTVDVPADCSWHLTVTG